MKKRLNRPLEQEFALLKARFFTRFKPGESIKKVTLPLYKIVALNVGTIPGKQILIKRLTDNEQDCISYEDLYSKFAADCYLDKFYHPLGFNCEKFETHAVLIKN